MRWCLVLLFLLVTHPAEAQDCACDHTIPAGEGNFDGVEAGVEPGDRVCLEAGDTGGRLRIERVVGTAAAPVVITNCGGVRQVGGPDEGVGFAIGESRFFHLTGTGDSGAEYGIEVVGSRDGAQGLAIGSLSTDFEVDHVEIHDAGFAGIMSKTDPSCDAPDLSGFVQQNVFIHHNYVHDVGGEGLYLGYSFFPEREVDCDGTPTVLRAHAMANVTLTDNVIERTGWDGLQLSTATGGALVARNLITDFGLEDEQYQNHGIQIGAGTTGRIEANTIARGPGIGIFWLGWGGAELVNNLIVDSGGDGITCDDRTDLDQPRFVFFHNTIVRPGRDGIRMYETLAVGNAFSNNIVAAPAEQFVTLINGPFDWTEEGNLLVDAVDEVGFVAATDGDFRLEPSSPAVGAAVPTDPAITTDHDGGLRDAEPDVGAFEQGAEPMDPVPGPGMPPPAASPPVASAEEGGCGCRVTGRPTASPSWLLVLLLAGLVARRGRPSGHADD